MSKRRQVKKSSDEEQPVTAPVADLQKQLTLFVGDEPHFSNTIEIFDAMPKYIWTKSRIKEDLPDSVLTRKFKLRDKRYVARIKPALIEKVINGKRKSVLMYPAQREEIVEEVLRKMAYNGDATDIQGEAGVIFTISGLRRELESCGHGMTYEEVMEALEVLSSASLECIPEGRDGEVIRGNYLGSMYLASRKDYLKEPTKARCFAGFHPLVTLSIRHQSFRLYNYEKSMAIPNELARYIYKRLSHHYVYAEKGKPYSFKLVTFLQGTPRGTSKHMKTDLSSMRRALNVLVEHRILASFDETQVKNPKDRRGTVDAEYVLEPHEEFVKHVIGANVKQKAVREQALKMNQEILRQLQEMEGDDTFEPFDGNLIEVR